MIRSSILVSAALLFAAPALAQTIEPARRAEVETIVREFFLKNPKFLEEVIKKLQDDRVVVVEKERRAAIAANKQDLFASPRQVVLGDPNASITLVEFFDYNCGYCKQAFADMQGVLDSEKDVKIVLKEFPILSQGSLDAARISIAAFRQDKTKYLGLHAQLLSEKGQVDKAKALSAARLAGFDAASLEAAANDPETTATIEESHRLAAVLGITGTPSYVIGEQILPGAVGAEALKEKIEEARAAAQAGR